jgi:amidase
MTADVENIDAPPERAMHRPPPLNLTAYQYWQVNVQQRELRQSYLDHWRETTAITGTGRPVDAILSPAAPYVAPPHGLNRYVHLGNFLNYALIVALFQKCRVHNHVERS